MTLWSSGFLLVGLFLSSSALTIDECRELITPHEKFVPAYGRWNFIMGFINAGPFQELFSTVLSMDIQFDPYQGPKKAGVDLVESIAIRHTTYCKYGESTMTLRGNTVVTDKSNFTCTYFSLPTCADCLLYLVYSRNTDTLLPFKHIQVPKELNEVPHYEALYLMTKGTSVSYIDFLETLQKAKCLGFEGEPNFIYHPKNTFCERPPKAN